MLTHIMAASQKGGSWENVVRLPLVKLCMIAGVTDVDPLGCSTVWLI
jgi:hypothetical protein